MNEADDLLNEATRLLRSVDSVPLAEAMDIRRRAMRPVGVANRIGRHAPIMTDQPTHRELLKPKV
jgi:hypothetical protein